MWGTELASGMARAPLASRAYEIADLVLSSFIRIVTHPSIFPSPSTQAEAMSFVEDVRHRPNSVSIFPSDRHWEIFSDLCGSSKTTAISCRPLPCFDGIKSGSEWITTDRDYGRFFGLRWRHPLNEERIFMEVDG